MELVRVDTQRAYERIWEKITTLELAPGAPINEQELAEELDMGTSPVREALRLLSHDNLVVVTPRHGLYVANVNAPDLEQISEMRVSLEALCARLAAQRATPDDLVVLEALRQEQATMPLDDSRQLFDLDHKMHQMVPGPAPHGLSARLCREAPGAGRRHPGWRGGPRRTDHA